MAGPGVRIHGSGPRSLGGGPGGEDYLVRLFHQALREPSSQNEHLLQQAYHARFPQGQMFGSGGAAGGAGGTQMNVAASALTTAANQLSTAARQLVQASVASRSSAAVQAGGSLALMRSLRGERLSVPSTLTGGGGGGGGRGGGFFHPHRFPGHMGRFARGATMLGEALGLPEGLMMPLGIAGAIAGLGYESLRYKTQLGGLAMGFANEAQPLAQLQDRIYALARAGSFSGAAATSRFFPGNFHTPGWMLGLGLGPLDAAQILDQFGIAPTSGNQAETFVKQLRTMALSPAFAGMNQGSVIGFARSMAGLGQEKPVGAGPLGPVSTGLAFILEEAVRKGMDRAQIMQSIQQSIQHMSGTALGISPTLTMTLFNRMLLSGVPGARTGQFQQNAFQSLQQAASQIGSNSPITTFALGAFAHATSQAALKKIMGPELYGAIAGTKAGRLQLQDIVSAAKGGNIGLAQGVIRSILSGNPPGYEEFVRRNFGSVLGGVNPNSLQGRAILGNLFGNQNLPYVLQTSPSGRLGTPEATARFLTSGNQIPFQYTGDYRKELEASGAPKALVDAVIKAGQAYGIDPRVLLAQMYAESGFNMHAVRRNKNGTYDIGPAQINSATARDYSISNLNLLENPDVAAIIEADIIKKRGIQGYNPHNPQEVPKFIAGYRHVFGGNYTNVPETFGMTAAAAQDAMTGAAQSFSVFGSRISAASEKMSGLAGSIDSMETAIKRFIDMMNTKGF